MCYNNKGVSAIMNIYKLVTAGVKQRLKRTLGRATNIFNNMKRILTFTKINNTLKLEWSAIAWSPYRIEIWTVNQQMASQIESLQLWIYRRKVPFCGNKYRRKGVFVETNTKHKAYSVETITNKLRYPREVGHEKKSVERNEKETSETVWPY